MLVRILKGSLSGVVVYFDGEKVDGIPVVYHYGEPIQVEARNLEAVHIDSVRKVRHANERRAIDAARSEGVKVRGKRGSKKLPNDRDDKLTDVFDRRSWKDRSKARKSWAA